MKVHKAIDLVNLGGLGLLTSYQGIRKSQKLQLVHGGYGHRCRTADRVEKKPKQAV